MISLSPKSLLSGGILALASLFLLSCSGGPDYGRVSHAAAPKIINVSEYDPKEKQRSGRSFSPSDQSALKANGVHGLIARIAKGKHIDRKCADFLAGAERQSMLLGTYYYVLPGESPRTQAQRYISRLRSIKASKGLQTPKVLLVADMHTDLRPSAMVSFVEEVHRLTGVWPVVYLENGPGMRARLRSASFHQKSVLRKCPYWLALYTNTHSGLETPRQLTQATGVWHDWVMWQYAGVWWKNGRSVAHHYQAGNWRSPKYFGNLDRPCERNGFNGSVTDMYRFWNHHSWAW